MFTEPVSLKQWPQVDPEAKSIIWKGDYTDGGRNLPSAYSILLMI